MMTQDIFCLSVTSERANGFGKFKKHKKGSVSLSITTSDGP